MTLTLFTVSTFGFGKSFVKVFLAVGLLGREFWVKKVTKFVLVKG